MALGRIEEFERELAARGVELSPKRRVLFRDIVALTDAFCRELLNDEYELMCRKMAAVLASEGWPLERGKPAGWACGIVYSVGWVNFLTDPHNLPYLKAEQIASGCGVSEATMHNRARDIREGLGLRRFDPDFTVPSRLDDNPLVWMMLVDGIPVDLRSAPRELQEHAYALGLIPYVPNERI